MKKVLAFLTLASVLGTASAATHPITYRTYTYTCHGGHKLPVSYVRFGDVNFAVISYKGERYGLAEAVSASGNRYVALAPGNGLQWWEAKGTGTFSAITSTDSTQTRNILTGCRIR